MKNWSAGILLMMSAMFTMDVGAQSPVYILDLSANAILRRPVKVDKTALPSFNEKVLSLFRSG